MNYKSRFPNQGGSEHPKSPITLIVNQSLMRPNFIDYLGSTFKIRASEATPKNSIILSRSTMGILVIDLAEISDSDTAGAMKVSGDAEGGGHMMTVAEVVEAIQSFSKIYRGTTVILVSPVFGEQELGFVTMNIIMPLCPSRALFLLAHGDAQAASHIQTIAKANDPVARKVVGGRISEKIKDIQSGTQDAFFDQLAASIGLSKHEANVLRDCFGDSIGGVVTATTDEILDKTPLSKETAKAIFEFLHKDSMTI